MGRGEYWRLIDSQGRPPGLLGMWPSRAVTFVENHDTGGGGLHRATFTGMVEDPQHEQQCCSTACQPGHLSKCP